MRGVCLLLFISLFIQGCRVDKKNPRTEHQSGPKLFEGRTAQPYQPIDGNSQSYSDLSKIFLNSKNLTDEEFKGHISTTGNLAQFNAKLVDAYQKNPSDPEVRKTLNQYRGYILEGCDVYSLTGCRNLEFFQRDPNVTSVLKILAKDTNEVKTYFRLMFLAYEMKSRSDDNELDKMVQQRSLELIKQYVNFSSVKGQSTMTMKNLSAAEKKEFEFASRFLATVFKTSSDLGVIAGGQELLAWISAPEFESVVGRDLTSSLFANLTAQLKQPALWNQFVTTFQTEQSQDQFSYTQIVHRIQKENPQLLQKLGIKQFNVDQLISQKSTDLAVIMYFQKLFNLRPSSREQYLLKIGSTDPKLILEYLNAFVRASLVERALYTHKQMGEFYRQYQTDGRASTELLFESQKFADQKLSSQWKDYLSRIEQLEIYFSEQIEKRYGRSSDSDLSEQVLKTRNLFEQLNPTIKYFVTYPNMFMFAFYASKLKLAMEFEDPFSSKKVVIDHNLILHDFMEGRVNPLFLFTSFRPNEGQRTFEGLDSVKMLWSLYFALATDVPKLYGISNTQFLEVFFRAYKEPADATLRKFITKNEDTLRADSELSKLMAYCSATPGRPAFKNIVTVTDIQDATFLGEAASTARPPLRTGFRILNNFNTDLKSSQDEAIEVLKTDVDPKLRRLYLIKSVLKEAANVDHSALNEIDRQLKETQRLRQRVLDGTTVLVDKLPPCLLKMRGIENERRHAIYNMELHYLRKVAVALNAATQTNDEVAVARQLKAQDQFFAELNESQPLPQALNELFAKKANLGKAFREIRDYQAHFMLNSGFKRDPSGRLYFNHDGFDLWMRLTSFLEFGFDGIKIPASIDQLHVALPASLREARNIIKSRGGRPLGNQLIYASAEQQIIRSGLSQFRAQVRWFNDMAQTTYPFRTILRHSVALHKYLYIAELNLEEQVNCDYECRKKKSDAAYQRSYQLFNSARTLLEATRLRERDIALLQNFEADSYFNFSSDGLVTMDAGPIGLFVGDSTGNSYNGLANDLFSYVTSIRLGYDPKFRGLRRYAEGAWEIQVKQAGEGGAEEVIPLRRADVYENAKSYFRTLRDQPKDLTFAIAPSVDAQIKLFHTYQIQADFELADIFIKAADLWNQRYPLPEAQFSLRVKPQQMIMLTPSLVGNYRAQIDVFHKDTENIFKQQ